MSTRRFSGRPGRDRAAERRGIIAQAFQRAVVEAELGRDRVKVRIAEIREQIDLNRGAGLDTAITEQHLAWLLVHLAEREADITRARRNAGFDDGLAEAIHDHLTDIGLDPK